MVRPKEFDREAVLAKAMEVFWGQGYEATSLDDLQKAMGIGRQSIYDTFGGKHELFLESLRFYRDTGGASLHSLFAAGSVKKAFRDLFMAIPEESAACQRRGCLLVNSTMELAGRDANAAAVIRENVKQLENVFVQALQRGKESGELEGGVETRATARFLVMAFLGLRAMAKATPDSQALKDVVRITLSVLK